MIVVPVPFPMEGGHRLQHAKWLLEETEEDGSSLVAINKGTFHKLVAALRTAISIEYKLDKEQTSYNDILDAFRLSLQFYKRSKNYTNVFTIIITTEELGLCCNQYKRLFNILSPWIS